MSHTARDHQPVSLREALAECYIGLTLLVAYVAVKIAHGSEVVSGGLLLFAAILAMLGFAKADLAIIGRPRNWLKHHPNFGILHKITNEGELAGIAIGAISFIVAAATGHLHSIPVFNCLALFGILAAARIASPDTKPVLRFLEHLGGVYAVLVGGGFLAMFLGPAASVTLVNYLKERVRPDKRAELAVQLAAVIGSGNGMMPYVAAPVLIVWPKLQADFHWTLFHFLGYIALPCLAYVLIASRNAIKLLKKEAQHPLVQPYGFSSKMVLPLLVLAGLVTAHIVCTDNVLLAGIDILVGIANIFISARRFPKNLIELPHEVQEDCFKSKWEPLILAGLLGALDCIGAEGTPFVVWAASFIPLSWNVLAIAAIFFLIAAPASGFADNALITKVFVGMIVPMIQQIGLPAATTLVVSVLLAALFGGTLTPPGNIPNFPIRAALRVESGDWMRAAVPLMIKTMPIYLAWILALKIILTS